MTIPNLRLKFYVVSILSIAMVLLLAQFYTPKALWAFAVLAPLILMGLYDVFQKEHAIRRNYPILGRLRYVMESFRPAIQQYFVENDLNGKPFSRRRRSLVYQRAKEVNENVPFGTQIDVYEEGYEWMVHSAYPLDPSKMNRHPKVRVGGADCQHPYDLSLYNISAMSYGSLSANAVMAMNKGAKKGGFAHNTGEGGVSPYHKQGGDLIWQLGTGYFGARAEDGSFDAEKYKKTVAYESIKMIELKLSQGAKPGKGGILPAIKNSKEIAKIRGVEPHQDVISPAYHKAFSSPEGLMHFIKKLRDLSGGKPVGFKLCIGSEQEFYDMCKAMIKTNIYPDFITIDGGEGGTGAAPVEFSDSLGMPMKEGLSFAIDTLRGFNLKKDIRVIAAGRITSAFDMVKVLAMGADACYSARAMMMAVGCIQALECHSNQCPTGVATQDKELMKGLHVDDKSERVYHFHKKTLYAFVDMMAAAGIAEPAKIKRKHIFRRTTVGLVRRYDQLYPNIPVGCCLNTEEIPDLFKREMLMLLGDTEEDE
ncbi:FMN-binding glutamate synthase family protein [Aureispira sp. CCB-QB1]|uniref:FMN-binding glutamate synthase family protein n=1 Tax=Aureispira sp. CCB-QB1 TaxID=1313421 RepID=UPI0006991859|nr:FMN-binding glutamate synthase family protein [Aureispira sp. CCB-QB1]